MNTVKVTDAQIDIAVALVLRSTGDAIKTETVKGNLDGMSLAYRDGADKLDALNLISKSGEVDINFANALYDMDTCQRDLLFHYLLLAGVDMESVQL